MTKFPEANDRYRLAVDRNLAELQRAIVNRTTLQGIAAVGRIRATGFLDITRKALEYDYVAHCIKVFERGKQCTGFWYIHQINPDVIEKCAEAMQIDLKSLDLISLRLRIVRNKTHFHIDRTGVMDTPRVWQDAAINKQKLSEAIDDAWSILRQVQDLIGSPPTELPSFYTEEYVRLCADAAENFRSQ